MSRKQKFYDILDGIAVFILLLILAPILMIVLWIILVLKVLGQSIETIQEFLDGGCCKYNGKFIVETCKDNIIYIGCVSWLKSTPSEVLKMGIRQWYIEDGELHIQVYRNEKLIKKMQDYKKRGLNDE